MRNAGILPPPADLFQDGPLIRWAARHPAARLFADYPWRRAAVALAVAWLPLALLSLASGRAFGGVTVPFFLDIQTQARLLVRLPLYVAGAAAVDRQLMPRLSAFLTRGIVSEADRGEFLRRREAVGRWARSAAVRLPLFALAAAAGHAGWTNQFADKMTSWSGTSGGIPAGLTPAGWWLMCVTNPIVAYLHVLWAARLLAFGVLLWRIAALDLTLRPSHPDQCGGLAFLGAAVFAFAPLAAAEGTVVAGILANRIFFEGQSLIQFETHIVVGALLVTAFILGPMLAFTPKLLVARQAGLRDYGLMATRYVRDFDRAWIEGKGWEEGRELLGTPDMQSLADLANSYGVVAHMRALPFTRRAVSIVLAAYCLPILPLLLTVVKVREAVHTALHSFLF